MPSLSPPRDSHAVRAAGDYALDGDVTLRSSLATFTLPFDPAKWYFWAHRCSSSNIFPGWRGNEVTLDALRSMGMRRMSSVPSGDSSYSTLGGDSSCDVRVKTPSSASSCRREVRTFGETPRRF